MRAAVEVCSHFFARVTNTIYFSGQILLKRKGQEWDFDFPNLPLFFYDDICMMAKESTPSKTGHSLVAMLNSKWIGVKVVSNRRLHHSRPLCHNAFLALGLHRREPLVGTHLFPNDPQLTTIRTPILRSRSPNSKSFAINLGYLEKKLEKVENVLHCSAKLTLIQFLPIYNSISILIFQVVWSFPL